MNIVVLNGSPKGPDSVTMQYIYYFQKRYSSHDFVIINAAQQLALYEKQETAFNAVMEKVEKADFILWAFPLYFLLVNSQYMRFIELIFERKRTHCFVDTYAASLSTSIHFFDHTAHNYIHSMCDDLGMNFVGELPAHMQDLMKPAIRSSIDSVFANWLKIIESRVPTTPTYAPINAPPQTEYHPQLCPEPVVNTGKRVSIIADVSEKSSNIGRMVEQMHAYFPEAQLVNLRELCFGPCRGCMKCGFDNHCAYEGKDDFNEMYRTCVLPADIIIFAGTLQRRYFSSEWQKYLERSFVKTHQTVLKNKQVCFLVSGPLSQNQNAQEVIKGYTETMQGNLVTIISDDSPAILSSSDSAIIDKQIEHTAYALSSFAEKRVFAPISFLGVAGLKIFRDEIYQGLRFVFQADHAYYKQHKLYDFPQKKVFLWLGVTAMVLMSKLPFLREKIRRKLKTVMLQPYKNIIHQAVSAIPAPAVPSSSKAVPIAASKAGID